MSETTRSEHWQAWYGEPEKRELGSVSERKPKSVRRQRQSVEVADHVWAMVKQDAAAHDLSAGKFLLVNWLNWRLERRSLSVIPMPPKESWEREKRAG